MTLEKIRKEIDALDDQMIDLLIRRMTLVEEVIIAKAEENRDVYKGRDNQEFKERIEEILERKIPTLTLNGLERARERDVSHQAEILNRYYERLATV